MTFFIGNGDAEESADSFIHQTTNQQGQGARDEEYWEVHFKQSFPKKNQWEVGNMRDKYCAQKNL